MRFWLDGRMSQTATNSRNSGLCSPIRTPPSSPPPIRAALTGLPLELLVAEVAGRPGHRDGPAGHDEALHEAAAGQVAGDIVEVGLADQLFFGGEIECHFDVPFVLSVLGVLVPRLCLAKFPEAEPRAVRSQAEPRNELT